MSRATVKLKKHSGTDPQMHFLVIKQAGHWAIFTSSWAKDSPNLIKTQGNHRANFHLLTKPTQPKEWALPPKPSQKPNKIS